MPLAHTPPQHGFEPAAALAAVGAAVPGPVVGYDRALRRRFVNAGYEAATGCRAPQVLGRAPHEGPADGLHDPVLVAALRAVLANGRAQSLVTLWPHDPAHARRRLALQLQAERDPQGEVSAVWLVGHEAVPSAPPAADDPAGAPKPGTCPAPGRHEPSFRSLADNAADNILRFDLDRRVVYVNPRLQRSVAPLQFVLGCTLGESFPDSRLEDMDRLLQQVLRTGEPAHIELDLPEHDGGQVTHQVLVAPEWHEDGRLIGAIGIGRDITDIKRVQQAAQLREREFRALVENSPDFIVRYNRQAERVYVNPALRRWADANMVLPLGVAAGEQSGLAQAEDYRALVDQVLADGCTRSVEVRFDSPDGGCRWLDTRICAQLGEDGAVESVFTIGRDITQAVALRERIHQQSMTDALTRLHNRQALYERGPGFIGQARRQRRKLGVLVLDVDRFKQVNDSLGHSAGDRLLAEVARRIATCVRESDLLVRLGGDEFALLAPDPDDELDMGAVAGKIVSALEVPFLLDERPVVVGASVGVALFPEDGDDLEQLMAHADVAMYEAKRAGRGRFEFYRKQFTVQARLRLALEGSLREAQHGAGLSLHFQPQLRLADGALVGAEALLRWQHPQLGFVSPATFIPIAEDTGLILPIGRWVMEQAMAAAVRWNQGRPGQPLRVAVNVSIRQFGDDLVGQVRQALQASGCRAEWLALEVTEGLLLEDSAAVQNTLAGLKALGLAIEIDDFGTGYSSLTYLDRFGLDGLKLDRAFIGGIEDNPRRRELLRACIAMAQALGMGLVAEGVETEAQAAFLRDHGCAVAQGYLFGRPVPRDEFEARWLVAAAA